MMAIRGLLTAAQGKQTGNEGDIVREKDSQ